MKIFDPEGQKSETPRGPTQLPIDPYEACRTIHRKIYINEQQQTMNPLKHKYDIFLLMTASIESWEMEQKLSKR